MSDIGEEQILSSELNAGLIDKFGKSGAAVAALVVERSIEDNKSYFLESAVELQNMKKDREYICDDEEQISYENGLINRFHEIVRPSLSRPVPIIAYISSQSGMAIEGAQKIHGFFDFWDAYIVNVCEIVEELIGTENAQEVLGSFNGFKDISEKQLLGAMEPDVCESYLLNNNMDGDLSETSGALEIMEG